MENDEEQVSGTACAKKEKVGRSRKRHCLSSYDVSQIIVQKTLHDRTELIAFANIQKQEGKTDFGRIYLQLQGSH